MNIEHRIKKLKTFAKRHARANRIAHSQSLDMIAMELGFAHWNSLMGASKAEWFPSDNDLTKVEAFVGNVIHIKNESGTGVNLDPFADMEPPEVGGIGKISFQIGNFFGDAVVYGEG